MLQEMIDSFEPIISDEGGYWFVAYKVAKMLGVKNIRNRAIDLPEKDRKHLKAAVEVSGKRVEREHVLVVSEAGLYRLISMSQTSEAKKYQDMLIQTLCERRK